MLQSKIMRLAVVVEELNQQRLKSIVKPKEVSGALRHCQLRGESFAKLLFFVTPAQAGIREALETTGFHPSRE